MRRIVRAEALLPITAAVLVVVEALTGPVRDCTPATPCGPDPVRWIGLGLLIAVAVMAYAHRWAAVAAATGAACAWPLVDPGPRALLPWLLVAAAVWLARRGADGVEQVSPRRRPPDPGPLPPVGRPLAAAAVLLGLAALALGAVVTIRQSEADARQAAAREEVGTVTARDGTTLTVRTDGVVSEVTVLDAARYAVGSPIRLYADDEGLRQPVAEPYDLSPWLALVTVGCGAAIALGCRVVRLRRGLRTFFGGPQAVRAVRVVDQFGYVHVLLPEGDHHTAVEFGIDVDESGPPPPEAVSDEHPETRPALLYGEPRPGRWCAVAVDGRMRVPTGPVTETVEIEYDEEHALPREVADDDEQLVNDEDLLEPDRLAAADQPREHRISPARAWLSVLLAGVGLGVVAAQLTMWTGVLDGWPRVVVVAVAAGAGYEIAWRLRLRPRLRWHAGGVAAIGPHGAESSVWTQDSAAVSDDRESVLLITGAVVLVVPAPRPWPSWSGQRTPDQLVAALRHVRQRALDGSEVLAPPSLTMPRRPWGLYLLFAATVAGLASW